MKMNNMLNLGLGLGLLVLGGSIVASKKFRNKVDEAKANIEAKAEEVKNEMEEIAEEIGQTAVELTTRSMAEDITEEEVKELNKGMKKAQMRYAKKALKMNGYKALAKCIPVIMILSVIHLARYAVSLVLIGILLVCMKKAGVDSFEELSMLMEG